MPQRTNAFQQLVDCIHRLFDDKNATFTTSAMISSGKGRKKREVDLLVEYTDTDGIPIKIAIEAKDLSKKVDAIGVETYIGKYASPGCLRVDKVIIVAHGFTKTAIARADDVGFCLKTINEIENYYDAESIFDHQHTPTGRWCISSKQSNEVNVELWDLNNRKIKLPLGSVLISNSRKNSYPASNFATMLLQNRIGTEANKIYYDNAGTLVSVVVEYYMNNYTAKYCGRTNQLRMLKFLFPEKMIFPNMVSKIQKVEEVDGDTKFVVEEIGSNADNVLRIVHETDKKLYVQHLKNDGKPAEKKIFTVKMNYSL